MEEVESKEMQCCVAVQWGGRGEDGGSQVQEASTCATE